MVVSQEKNNFSRWILREGEEATQLSTSQRLQLTLCQSRQSLLEGTGGLGDDWRGRRPVPADCGGTGVTGHMLWGDAPSLCWFSRLWPGYVD